jgi:hypothetical protein
MQRHRSRTPDGRGSTMPTFIKADGDASGSNGASDDGHERTTPFKGKRVPREGSEGAGQQSNSSKERCGRRGKVQKIFVMAGLGNLQWPTGQLSGRQSPRQLSNPLPIVGIDQTCTYAVRLSSPVDAVALAWRLTPGAVTAAEWRILRQNFERSS